MSEAHQAGSGGRRELQQADRHDIELPAPPESARRELAAAEANTDLDARRAAVGAVVAAHPAAPDGWAVLAGLGREPIERYAYARVGYHRGLDALRAHGWGGTNYVRWATPTNRGFLTCLVRLREAAREIGEDDEVTRIDEFLRQLDPDWDDTNVT